MESVSITEPQYGAEVDALLGEMQKMIEQKYLNESVMGFNSDSSDDRSYDSVGVPCTSIAYYISQRELA